MTPSTKPRQCDRTDLHTEHEFYDGGFYRRQCPGLVADRAPADDAYARGVAEGRRQATEGWGREWGVDLGLKGNWPLHPCDSEPDARRVAAARAGRTVASRLVGPWEPDHRPGVSDVG